MRVESSSLNYDTQTPPLQSMLTKPPFGLVIPLLVVRIPPALKRLYETSQLLLKINLIALQIDLKVTITLD